MKSLLVMVIMLIAAATATVTARIATKDMVGNKCDIKWEKFRSYDGCNTCECGMNNILTCGTDYCDPNKECIPGSTIPAGDGCNKCFCREDGKISGCTLMDCLRSEACKAGDVIPAGDGCNNCTCVEDGKVGRCTLHTDCCKPGTSVPAPDGCNTCICTNHGMRGNLCTLGYCHYRIPRGVAPVSEN